MTHFWKAFSKSDVEHVWRKHARNPNYTESLCGIVISSYWSKHAGTRHCKKCEKIIRRREDVR